MAWLQITFTVAASVANDFSEQLEQFGALSITLQDAADQPLYEPDLNSTPLWDLTQIVGLFADDADVQALAARLQPQPDYRIEVLEEQDWLRLCQRDFKPTCFGKRLWICPSWSTAPEPDALNIALDPGLAFGTGTHPTTALCLAWLDKQESLAGEQWIDYGCGSGILGIAALKLGAKMVWGVDTDPQALQASLDNAFKNNVAAQFPLCLPPQLPAQKADGILANILANPLCELQATLADLIKPKGFIVLSGILAEQREQVSSAYQANFDLIDWQQQGDWIRIVAQRHA